MEEGILWVTKETEVWPELMESQARMVLQDSEDTTAGKENEDPTYVSILFYHGINPLLLVYKGLLCTQ